MTSALPAAAPALDAELCERARQARDPRFDGRFFIGVITTGIYCRPICPARIPRPENVRFYPSAAAAAAAGFRPCLRCRPECSPGTATWQGTGSTVSRALRLIEQGALDGASVEALAARLGLGARHLGRLFVQHLGASPLQVAQTRRLQLAKKLLDETDLPMTELAHACGYGSVRRFNEAIRAAYARSPGTLRGRRGARSPGGAIRLYLGFRPPLDWDGLLAFFAARALRGVEQIEGSSYRRTIALGGARGAIAVRPCPRSRQLELHVEFPDVSALGAIAGRVRRLFDLNADPLTIERDLGRDPALAASLASAPGTRIPGAWDGFELAVRAILGQGVTVQGARTLAERLVARFGERLPSAAASITAASAQSPGLELLFPGAAVLARADLRELGVPPLRAAAITRLAQRVVQGEIDLDSPQELDAFAQALQDQPGIGPWTAQYVALRALGQPDAFPASDLGLLRGAEHCLGLAPGELGAAALERRARAWRPWRGYAALHLWRAYAALRASGSAAVPGELPGDPPGRVARARRTG